MRIFQTKLFDGYVSGTTNVYTQTADADLLGSVERLTLGVVVNAVSGTNPTITVQIENSPDGTRWMNQYNTVPEINGVTLVAADSTLYYSTNQASTTRSSPTVPIASFIRMRIALGGTSPGAYVRLWVVGRSPAF